MAIHVITSSGVVSRKNAKRYLAEEIIFPETIKTIEDGVMTGDLYLLSSLENKKKVDTEEFLKEIAVRLDEMM